MNIGQRFYSKGVLMKEEKERKNKQILADKEAAEVAACSFKPKLHNSNSKRFNKSVDNLSKVPS